MNDLAAQTLGAQFVALAREGASLFSAMSRSRPVSDQGQYACAILDGDGRLIAQDQGEPSHLAAVQSTVAHLLDAFAFNIGDGDVILSGDPHCGGTWCGVLTLARPLFFDGDLRFVAALRFALPDLSGEIPGLFQPHAHEIWQEALRVTPVKLIEASAAQQDLRRYLLRNTRAPRVLDNDLKAAVRVTGHIGARIAAQVDHRGLGASTRAAEARIAYSRARAEAHLAEVACGRAAAQGIGLVVEHDEAGLAIDLDGTDGISGSASNMTLAATRAVALSQLAGELIEDGALAQGLLDAIAVRCSDNCILAAKAPAAVSLGWRITAPKFAAALAEATGTVSLFAPPVPLLMMFEEIGSVPESHPAAISPGFVRTANGSGSDAASGRRRLMSVEMTEIEGRLSVASREATETGMVAEVVVMAEGFEAITVPGGPEPEITQSEPLERKRSAVLSLAPGARIRFDYPAIGRDSDARV
ncbi:MAG: hydantoinase B/oxoprolinase family protein [Albidovulum sp.]|nr:hydantoinase B/oxoprolinase family protein [Albidovulum sp.]MDE0308048.1 hydantoinase B/oxoprolinase family protein [Albidovulum sp.]MDE0533834.1 hydantoinase B/oxoprolinase family protein [Albidovulum sp.]